LTKTKRTRSTKGAGERSESEDARRENVKMSTWMMKTWS
jgi:hypothetical protein